jgi:hypothetical protein
MERNRINITGEKIGSSPHKTILYIDSIDLAFKEKLTFKPETSSKLRRMDFIHHRFALISSPTRIVSSAN